MHNYLCPDRKENSTQIYPPSRFADLPRILLATLFFLTMGLEACGDKKTTETPSAGGPPPLNETIPEDVATAIPTITTKGIITGSLIVPPRHHLEIEPNNSLIQAQPILDDFSIAGQAGATDVGFSLPSETSIKIEDLFAFRASGPVRMTLRIAEDDLEENDLDLFLMDTTGKIIDLSQGLIATEFIETSGEGDFIVGIRVFKGASAYALDLTHLGSRSSTGRIVPVGADFVPGEFFIKLKTKRVSLQRINNATRKYTLKEHAVFPGDTYLMGIAPSIKKRQKGQVLSNTKVHFPKSEENELKALTLQIIETFQRDPAVEYAEAHFIRQPLLLPNDDLFPRQWHYPLINLPQAWEISTGSDDVIVAVIDTGVLLNHPDLQTRLIAGYDFISDPKSANDGDGIDPDPDDPGDDPIGSNSSFHGTHVAGTIGAHTNNASGVSGVTWQTKLMPLRVLGVGGGSDADITQAILYAAGLPNISGILPTKRADIINMSLGSPGFSQTQQDAILAARAAGVIVVAAAGNDNTGIPFFPASYEGVISVAAVDSLSRKAPYSNFGAKIDVAAPGGNSALDVNGDGFSDGVLSTMGDDAGNFLYLSTQGTSMASPHVAGVIALMLAVNPNLIPSEMDQLLSGTHTETTTRITRDLGNTGRDDLFGQGLIDAEQAVRAAGEIPGRSGQSILQLSTSDLNFSYFINTLRLDIENAGIGTLNISSVSDDVDWLSVSLDSNTTPSVLSASVDREALPDGNFSASITITSDAEAGSKTATVNVSMRVGDEALGNVGEVIIQVLDTTSQQIISQTRSDAARDYLFQISGISAGSYRFVAGTDRDGDGTICEIEDVCGSFPDTVTVTAGAQTSGINFIVGDLSSD